MDLPRQKQFKQAKYKQKYNRAKQLLEQQGQSLNNNNNSCQETIAFHQQKIQRTSKRSWILLIVLSVSLVSSFYFYSLNVPEQMPVDLKKSYSTIQIQVPIEADSPGLVTYKKKTKSQQLIEQMLSDNTKINNKQKIPEKSVMKSQIKAKEIQSIPKPAISNQIDTKNKEAIKPVPAIPNANQQNVKNTDKKDARPAPRTMTAAGITQDQKLLAKILHQKKSEVEQKKIYDQYQAKYNISSYKQIPFCVVVPTYNNIANNRYLLNIESIVRQNYSNYRVLIIDDASTDDTGKKIQEYINKNNLMDKFSYKKNEQKLSAMPNLRFAAMNFCKSYEVYLIVDGDDQLIGKNVFKLFNANFQHTKSYFVYSNFLSSKGSIGYSRPFRDEVIEKNRYRKAPLLTSHLRAFYTKLFQLINQEDLKNKDGQYLHAANDVAICIPSLEMSGKRVTYVREITYLYNANTGLNNHLVRLRQQKANDRYIRTKQSYNIVDNLFTEQQIKQGGLEFLLEQKKQQTLQKQQTSPIIKDNTPNQSPIVTK